MLGVSEGAVLVGGGRWGVASPGMVHVAWQEWHT